MLLFRLCSSVEEGIFAIEISIIEMFVVIICEVANCLGGGIGCCKEVAVCA